MTDRFDRLLDLGNFSCSSIGCRDRLRVGAQFFSAGVPICGRGPVVPDFSTFSFGPLQELYGGKESGMTAM